MTGARREGFTLIELLVVIAIIAILMAILVPTLRRAKELATSIPCLANMRTISVAFFCYQSDNDGFLASSNVWQPPEQFSDGEVGYHWVACPLDEDGIPRRNRGANPTAKFEKNGIAQGVLWPYIKEFSAYHCPGDQRASRIGVGFRSYSMVAGIHSQYGEWLRFEDTAIKMGDIESPSSKYIAVEESEGGTDISMSWWNMGSWVIDIYGEDWYDPVAGWHSWGSNLAFADGHAIRMKWKDKRTREWLESGGVKNPSGHEGSADMRYMVEHVARKRK